MFIEDIISNVVETIQTNKLNISDWKKKFLIDIHEKLDRIHQSGGIAVITLNNQFKMTSRQAELVLSILKEIDPSELYIPPSCISNPVYKQEPSAPLVFYPTINQVCAISDSVLLFSFRYNEELVTRFKKNVKLGYASYNETYRTWMMKINHLSVSSAMDIISSGGFEYDDNVLKVLSASESWVPCTFSLKDGVISASEPSIISSLILKSRGDNIHALARLLVKLSIRKSVSVTDDIRYLAEQNSVNDLDLGPFEYIRNTASKSVVQHCLDNSRHCSVVLENSNEQLSLALCDAFLNKQQGITVIITQDIKSSVEIIQGHFPSASIATDLTAGNINDSDYIVCDAISYTNHDIITLNIKQVINIIQKDIFERQELLPCEVHEINRLVKLYNSNHCIDLSYSQFNRDIINHRHISVFDTEHLSLLLGSKYIWTLKEVSMIYGIYSEYTDISDRIMCSGTVDVDNQLANLRHCIYQASNTIIRCDERHAPALRELPKVSEIDKRNPSHIYDIARFLYPNPEYKKYSQGARVVYEKNLVFIENNIVDNIDVLNKCQLMIYLAPFKSIEEYQDEYDLCEMFNIHMLIISPPNKVIDAV